jgi:hypothetical protein
MKHHGKETELIFRKLEHFWLDSGLLGLVKMIEDINSDIQVTIGDISR